MLRTCLLPLALLCACAPAGPVAADVERGTAPSSDRSGTGEGKESTEGLSARVAALEATVTTLSTDAKTNAAQIATLESRLTAAEATLVSTQANLTAATSSLAKVEATAGTNSAQIAAQSALLAALSEIAVTAEDLAPYATYEYIDTQGFLTAEALSDVASASALDGLQAQVDADLIPGLGDVLNVDGDDVVFTGVNVQIVSGSGSTEGTPNGLGNLIIGYNENWPVDSGSYLARTGSHNLVMGTHNDYSSIGGVVSGHDSSSESLYSVVLGAQYGRAYGYYSVVVGGVLGTAGGVSSVVVGGSQGSTIGGATVTVGGQENVAEGYKSAVFGGQGGWATGQYASVLGGADGEAIGDWSTTSGGDGTSIASAYGYGP